ncbi:MAG: hypothetical protein KBD47_02705 [Candidatus Pacebacteria bacterium]|nr:hypothetical protein [Candidatus Paceibacterota bacterium]
MKPWGIKEWGSAAAVLVLSVIAFFLIKDAKSWWENKEARSASVENPTMTLPEIPSQASPMKIKVGRHYDVKYWRPTHGTRFSPRIIILGTNSFNMERDGIPGKVTTLPSPSDPDFHEEVVGGENGTPWKYFRLKLTRPGPPQDGLLYYQ